MLIPAKTCHLRPRLLLAVALGCCLGSRLPGVTLTTGLVGYWRFDEGSGTALADASGTGNHGTLVNGPAWTTGHSGGGLAFNGTNQRVQISSPVALPTGNAARTVAVWVMLSGEVVTGGVNRYQSLVSWGTPLSNTSLFSVERGADVHPDRIFALGWNDDANSNTAGAFPLNSWAHIAVTFDGTTVNFFVNGVADGSASRTYNTVLNASGLVIGNVDANDGWHLGLKGVLDELYIYDRALSPAEIGQLMAAPIPEPAAWTVLAGLGALGFAAHWHRRQSCRSGA